MALLSVTTASSGSSPRTWGNARECGPRGPAQRFIPTHVGKCSGRSCRPVDRPVHPHARGEMSGYCWATGPAYGSSPRTWGNAPRDRARLPPGRFIPTHVGKWGDDHRYLCPGPVHPHARGEMLSGREKDVEVTGSSPRTWGNALPFRPFGRVSRFIPTHVGKCRYLLCGKSASAVHPHARGEMAYNQLNSFLNQGSSPRTWGNVQRLSL